MRTRAKTVGIALIAGFLPLAATMPGTALAEDGNWFTNMLKYGGTTVPPSQPADLGEVYCPTVDVAENGAALRSYGGRADDNASLRSQITLGRLARECVRLADGSVSVKVGVEGQVLLGPQGRPGRFEAPVYFTIKAGDQTIVARARKVAVSIGPGEAQGLFTVIEENLVVPRPLSESYEIGVSLHGAPGKAAAKRKRKPAPTSAAAPAEAAPEASQ
ncbi:MULTISPECIES: hypothetical protein [Methylobacterium]|jgi:hypothetical protein|uniref:Uncharacterized protein n=2 Tax=Methylobacterium bullatum TaxID=570505 RepID=A0A679K2Z5_9HYPH|nr:MULTISPECIES: hypothetical protein [unclassified Methylobacterium]KQO43376.1 hypothetical protein ASF08_08375 [Methylobacterium sp. Leaf85]TXN32595.1 hypothetical protein FV220_04990 [Methylobacterium sp. WL19]CAA2143806.1 hypothetical protein MBLL_03019 [Methylobacterium bullatum]